MAAVRIICSSSATGPKLAPPRPGGSSIAGDSSGVRDPDERQALHLHVRRLGPDGQRVDGRGGLAPLGVDGLHVVEDALLELVEVARDLGCLRLGGAAAGAGAGGAAEGERTGAAAAAEQRAEDGAGAGRELV